jgi:hypothetical protein
MTDIDTLHYDYQEAASLQKRGWTVIPPSPHGDTAPCPGKRCLTETPGGRLCAYCRRSEAMERAA